jgi:hypothetical protein
LATESIVKITGTDHFKVLFEARKFEYGPHLKIALIDGDGSEYFPNLALQKISAWEKRNGASEVKLIKIKHKRTKGDLGIHPDSLKELDSIQNYDRIYASFIFTRSKEVARKLQIYLPKTIIGGTGVDEYLEMKEGDMRAQPKMISQLPYEVENMYPDHELYESEYADLNTSFWNNPDDYKYVRKYKDVIETYLIQPTEGTWGESGLNKRTEGLLSRFNEALKTNGFKDGKTYRGSTRGNGYSSKGCPRKCTFCVVPVIQGNLQPQHYGLLGVINWVLPDGFYATMDEIVELYKHGRLRMRPHLFWDHNQKVTRVSPFMTISDNNFPADPTCIEKMDYMIANNIAVNLNQGMDARLLTSKARVDKSGVRFPSGDEICEKISKLYFMNFTGLKRQLHFSWDFLSVGRLVIKGLTKLVDEYGLKYSNFTIYCLSGFDTSFDDDLQRVMTLRKLGVDPYVMLFRNVDGSEGSKFDGTPQDWRMKHLARWVNNKIIWRKTTFENYDAYLKELKEREGANWTQEHEYMAQLDCFDWLTGDYINHA